MYRSEAAPHECDAHRSCGHIERRTDAKKHVRGHTTTDVTPPPLPRAAVAPGRRRRAQQYPPAPKSARAHRATPRVRGPGRRRTPHTTESRAGGAHGSAGATAAARARDYPRDIQSRTRACAPTDRSHPRAPKEPPHSMHPHPPQRDDHTHTSSAACAPCNAPRRTQARSDRCFDEKLGGGVPAPRGRVTNFVK